MKILVLQCSIIFLLITTTISPQIIRTYGFKIGIAHSQQIWNKEIQKDWPGPINGFQCGGYIEFLNNDKISIQLQLNYIQKGWKFTFPYWYAYDSSLPDGYGNIGPIEKKQRFDFITAPILAKLRFNNKVITPYFSIGPSIDYLLSIQPNNFVFPDIVEDKFKKLSLSGSVNAGIEVNIINIPKFFIEINYSPTITNLYEFTFGENSYKLTNYSINISVGTSF